MDDTSLTLEKPDPDLPKWPLKTSAAIRAENRLAGVPWPISLTLCETEIFCAAASETPSDLNGFLRAALRIDDQPAELFLTRALYDGIARLIDREALIDDLDGKVRALLLEAGMAADLERLEHALGWQVALEQVHPAQDRQAIDLFWLDVTLEDGLCGLLGLSLPVPHGGGLANLLDAARPDQAIEKEPLPLPVALSLRAGSTVLGLADLESLRPGDILLMDHTMFGAGRIALAGGCDAWLFDAALGDDGVTLASGRRAPHSRDRELWLMDDLDHEPDSDTDQAAHVADVDPGDPPSLDQLPIKLVFEIGRLSVTIGELGELGPGHVFDLDRALHGSVDIRAAGQKIGKGEIVEIDGRIGVRIGCLFTHA